MRRALAPVLALSVLACSRDLELPSSAPPRVDAAQLVGLEASAAPVPLPVLGGELVALRGGTFPADLAQLEVRIGAEDAEVVEVAPDRVVVRVPALSTFGPVDLQVRSPAGFRTHAGALRYDGSGQPAGFGTSDLPTSTPLRFVAPVLPPRPSGFPDLAIAVGASDSALLVLPAAGVAVTTIPLGLVPTSAAARVVAKAPASDDVEVQVLALSRGGEVALGSAVLSSTASIVSRVAARPLARVGVSPAECSAPQVLFTNVGTPVAAWVDAAGSQRIAAIDMDAALGLGRYAPLGPTHAVAAPIVGWAPFRTTSVVFAAGSEIYTYDAAAPAVAPQLLRVGTGLLAPTVSELLAQGCAADIAYYTLAAAEHPYPSTNDALAVSYRAGGADRVALVDVAAGTARRGIAGTLPTSLALAPDPPFGAAPRWAVLAAGISTLLRFRPLDGVPGACADDLVPDAALPLSSGAGILPTFGGMATTAGGTRLLATTPAGDLVTVFPPSLTSAGSVLRLASYGGLSMQRPSIGGEARTVAVAEHAASEGDLASLDTGSALLVVSLSADAVPLALGGSGYGRGAVWLDPPGTGGALAYTGDLPASGVGSIAVRGGAAAVTEFTAGICPGEDVRITRSRPVQGLVDLLAQGPAVSGALGPEGIARHGPLTPPVYAARGTELDVYLPDPASVACLAGASPDAIDWEGCPPERTVQLGVEPVDVTLAAGDRAVAVRSLEPDGSPACADGPGFTRPCAAGDLLCRRATCPPARQLVVVPADAGATPVTLPLPARPAGVVADPGGGFLVTLRCEATGADGGDDCFPADALCDAFATNPGGADGALVLVAEDGAGAECLAVLPALAGPLAVTPNGAEAWVTGDAFGAQILSRLALRRRTSDGALDPSLPAERVAVEALGAAARTSGAFPGGGVAFTPDGGTGIVTVPAEFRILLYQ